MVYPARCATAIVEAVEKLDLAYPTVDAKKEKELQTARAALGEKGEEIVGAHLQYGALLLSHYSALPSKIA